MPSPRTSSSDKSYDIIEVESGHLELHKVQKPQQVPSSTTKLLSVEVDKEKIESEADTAVQAKVAKETIKETDQELQGELIKSHVKEVAAAQKIEVEKSPPKDTLKGKEREKEQPTPAATTIEVAAQQPKEWIFEEQSTIIDESDSSQAKIMGVELTDPTMVSSINVSQVEKGKLSKILPKDLTQEERQAYLAMLEGYPRLFIDGYDQITGVFVVQHHIKLKDGAKSVVQRLQRLGVIQEDALLSEMAQAKVTEAEQAKVAEVEFKALQALILAPPPTPAMTTPTMVDPKGKLSIDLHSHPDIDEEDCKQDDVLEIDAWMQHFGGKRKAFGPGAVLAHYISTLLAGEAVIVHVEYSPNGWYNLFALQSLSKTLCLSTLAQLANMKMAQAEVTEAEQAKVAMVEFKALQALILAPPPAPAMTTPPAPTMITKVEFKALQALILALPPAPAMTTPILVDQKGKLNVDLHSHLDTDEEDCKQDVYIMFIA
ncbi:hypothetical protein L7F22_025999 [Adiantum nelumboides]|nr:hypothetical protein [Adiantum nelumboides]